MSYLGSLTSHLDTGPFDLDNEFLFNMDLDTSEQTCVDDIMSDVSVAMTFEEEVTLMQDGGLLDLSDPSTLPCKLGIEAQDLGSLLDQFEEASQTLGDCDFLQPTINFFSNEVDENKEKNDDLLVPAKKELTDAMIQKLKTTTKQKSTVMLPLAVPAKRGRGRAMTRGHPVGLPSNCTPRRLQRVMQQNVELKDSLALLEPEPEPEPKPKKSGEPKRKAAVDTIESTDVDDNYFNLIVDHDYTKNVANPKVEPDDRECDRKVYDDIEEGELVENNEEGEIIEKELEKFKKNSDKTNNDRNYRKRAESPEYVTDTSLYFDKLPSYYTALSIPRKQFKKTASASCVGRGGISVHDYIERDRSPVRDDSMYNKLPDYHSSFTNSTKYDSVTLDLHKSSEDSKLSSGYSSLTQSPERMSRSRSRSSSRCSDYRPTKRSSKRRSSYSSYSGYSSSRSRSCSRSSCDGSHSSRSSSSSSSSSCSTCESRSPSRSRSRSPVSRSWQRERSRRQERSISSRKRADAGYRSRSRSSSSSSRRNRSGSRDFSSRRYAVRERSLSRERFREERKKQREDEKKRQMKDRRIVYVGGIPSSYTRHQLKDKFSHFGEIEHVQLHFREHGDNYGFVTFVYTCDAFAAIEKGRSVPGLEKFDLCFGGRRQFCDVEYADLDGNKEIEEEYESKPRNPGMMDFDELLKQARQKIKKS